MNKIIVIAIALALLVVGVAAAIIVLDPGANIMGEEIRAELP